MSHQSSLNFNYASEVKTGQKIYAATAYDLATSLKKDLRSLNKNPKVIVDYMPGTSFLSEIMASKYKDAALIINHADASGLEKAISKGEHIGNCKGSFPLISNATDNHHDSVKVFAKDERADLITGNLSFHQFKDIHKTMSELWKQTDMLAVSLLTEDSLKDWKKAHAKLGLENLLPKQPCLEDVRTMGFDLNPNDMSIHFSSGVVSFSSVSDLIYSSAPLYTHGKTPNYTDEQINALRQEFPRGYNANYRAMSIILSR